MGKSDATGKDELVVLVNARLRKILSFAELAMERDKYEVFRKLTLDEYGKSGLIRELERGGRSRER